MRITSEMIKAIPLNPSVMWYFHHLNPEFDGTHKEFMDHKDIRHDMKLKVLLHYAPRKVLEKFAITCAFRVGDYADDLYDEHNEDPTVNEDAAGKERETMRNYLVHLIDSFESKNNV